MTATAPILQFGTSRFLLAHADLFVSDALAAGKALGKVTVAQTTDNPASARRVAALNSRKPYLVRIRGLRDGVTVDDERWVSSVDRAVQARHDWRALCDIAADGLGVIISNTGDNGYRLHENDVETLAAGQVPASYPAKLVALLYARWRARGGPVSVFPCELVSRNGDQLRDTVLAVAAAWDAPAPFRHYLQHECLWISSVVDRIVSEPIEPVGAVAEPYALWAIEYQPGMVLPCRHPAIVLTGSLDCFERLKLYVLNLGHTLLAELWLAAGAPSGTTVLEAMEAPGWRARLEAAWREEVLPVFEALGEGKEAASYVVETRERFLNPFLRHQLRDIAQNHAEKKRRRLAPVVDKARKLGLTRPLAQLEAALGSSLALDQKLTGGRKDP